MGKKTNKIIVILGFVLLSLAPILSYLHNLNDDFLASFGDHIFILDINKSVTSNFVVYNPEIAPEQNVPILLSLYSPYYVYLYVFHFFGLPNILRDLLFISLIFFVSLFCTYKFLLYVFDNKLDTNYQYKKLVAFGGAVFYSFTPFYVSYFSPGHFLFLIITATFPLILKYYDIFLFKKKVEIKYVMYLFLIFLLSAQPYGNLGDIEVLMLIISVYTFVLIILYKLPFVKTTFRLACFFLAFLFANFWWLLPTILTLGNLSALNEQSKLTIGGAINTATKDSTILKILFGQAAGFLPLSKRVHNFYLASGIYLFYLIISIFGFIALLKNKIKYLSVLLLIMLFAMYFSKGPNPPQPNGFNYLYDHVIGFQVFRRPASKIYWLFILCLSSLGFSGLLMSLRYLKRKIYKVLLLVLVFSGLIYFIAIFGYSKELKTYAIPDVYYSSKEYLKSQKVSKILLLPDLVDYPFPRYGGALEGQQGFDFLNQIWDFSKYTPDSTSWTLSTSKRDKINLLANKIYNENEICNLTKELNISHVVVRGDLNEIYYPAEGIDKLIETLKKNPDLNTSYRKFQYLGKDYQTIFTVTDSCRKDIFYSENNRLSIQYKKIDSTKYNVEISKIKETDNLIFSDSFSKNWQMHNIDNNSILNDISYLWKKPLFNNVHTLAFNYANAWTIDPEYIKKNIGKSHYRINEDGSIDITLTLYYKPQSYLYLGLIISSSCLLFFMGYFYYYFLRRKKIPSNKWPITESN